MSNRGVLGSENERLYPRFRRIALRALDFSMRLSAVAMGVVVWAFLGLAAAWWVVHIVNKKPCGFWECGFGPELSWPETFTIGSLFGFLICILASFCIHAFGGVLALLLDWLTEPFRK